MKKNSTKKLISLLMIVALLSSGVPKSFNSIPDESAQTRISTNDEPDVNHPAK